MENTLGYELSNGGSIPSGRTTNNIKYNMFAKLKKSFVITGGTIGNEVISYGNGTIKYNDIDNLDVTNYYSVIPEIYRRFFWHKLMTITEDIVPHTDNGMKTSINFYIKSNNGMTKFYEPTTPNFKFYREENQGDGCNYHPEDLKLINAFIAKDFDAYLLDVTKIHAVVFNDTRPILRTAFVLQTPKFNYQQVLKMLEETGNI